MQRRDFFKLLGASAVTPIAEVLEDDRLHQVVARAQQICANERRPGVH